MLNDEDWDRIRAYTNEVISRERSQVLFMGGSVSRDEVDHRVVIALDPMQVDLEPEGFMDVQDAKELQ